MLDDLERMCVLEQRLGRDATPQQAGAAERLLLLDDGDSQSNVRGANGRHIPACAGADDDEVVILQLPDRFSEESGTKLVAAGPGRAGAGVSPAGSSRTTRARSWPYS